MEPRYATPKDLVEALHARTDGARRQLWQGLREPLGRLLDGLVGQHRLAVGRDRIMLHALHSAETYLRTRPPREFEPLTWTAFRATVLLQVAKLASHPFTAAPGPASGPPPLPPMDAYHSQTFFLPHDRVGDHFFGGDWFGGLRAEDGALWVLVADITGHGYHAYLLASTLPGVWQACWDAAAPEECQPADLLAAMHDLLEDCLPDGIFVECTLARLGPDGEATVAPAGGTRLLVRRGGAGRADLLKLRGSWLGVGPPLAGDQHTYRLGDGDELLLATDGLYDQLEDAGADVADLLTRTSNTDTLLDDAWRLLREALRRTPQKDDITMVLLRRRARVEDGPAVASPGPPLRNGTGNVPV
jgi:hypothetical protein